MLKHSLVNLDSGFQITLHGWGGGKGGGGD